MAAAKQLKAFLGSYADGDDAQFLAVAMQIAAHEARQGHGKLAEDLRGPMDRAKLRQAGSSGAKKLIPLAQPRGELATLLSMSTPKLRLSDLILEPETGTRLERLLQEQRHLSKLGSVGSYFSKDDERCHRLRGSR